MSMYSESLPCMADLSALAFMAVGPELRLAGIHNDNPLVLLSTQVALPSTQGTRACITRSYTRP